MPEEAIRMLLVEDHAFTRDGLRAAINLEADLRVVAEARSGEEALESAWRGTEVDVGVWCDIGLPGMDGIQTAAEIKRGWPAVRMVMLTAHDLRNEVLRGAGRRGRRPTASRVPSRNCCCWRSGRRPRAAPTSIRRWPTTFWVRSVRRDRLRC